MADDQGAVAPVVAILVVLFVALTALAVDIGYFYNTKRQLQAAADACSLAGVQQLILHPGDKVGAFNEAVAYAQMNAKGAGAHLSVIPEGILNPSTGNPYTEVTDDSVKITVEQTDPTIFGRIFDIASALIRAQSRAKIAYLTGARNVMPWALPILNATAVRVQVGSGALVDLSNTGTAWEGDVPVSGPAGTAEAITIHAINDQGVDEVLGPPAGYVSFVATSSPIKNVQLSAHVADSGGASVELFVEATSAPSATFNGHRYDMSPTGVPYQYQASLSVPDIGDEMWQAFPIAVSVGSGHNVITVAKAEALAVRRPTYPISAVDYSRTFFEAGSDSVHVHVKLNDYEYEKEYPLKVDSSPEVGNFCSIALASITRPDGTQPYAGLGSSGGSFYRDCIAGLFPQIMVHIGDQIDTEPGNAIGPTRQGLEERFGSDNLDYETWKIEKPPTSRLVVIPVCEKLEELTGRKPLLVVQLAEFYVDPQHFDGTVIGHFLRYLEPGDYSDEPTGGFYIETPHLTAEGLDF